MPKLLDVPKTRRLLRSGELISPSGSQETEENRDNAVLPPEKPKKKDEMSFNNLKRRLAKRPVDSSSSSELEAESSNNNRTREEQVAAPKQQKQRKRQRKQQPVVVYPDKIPDIIKSDSSSDEAKHQELAYEYWINKIGRIRRAIKKIGNLSSSSSESD